MATRPLWIRLRRISPHRWWRGVRPMTKPPATRPPERAAHRGNGESIERAEETLRAQEAMLRRLVPWVIGETEVIERQPDHGNG